MKILGIDPGLAVTGYGIIEVDGDKVKLLNAGTHSTSSGMLSERLRSIFMRVKELLDTEVPAEVAIEEGFYGKNVKVAMSLGQARGVVVLACALNGVPIYEYSPREVKQAVVGRGAASKEQVNYMIKQLLNLRELPSPLDVSDALAVAYCHVLKKARKF
jgi:crossover junction endodeoxyribonuclease RuvC